MRFVNDNNKSTKDKIYRTVNGVQPIYAKKSNSTYFH